MPAHAEELARRVLDALSREDVEGFAGLLHPRVRIHTARGVREGPDEARRWASRAYAHLVRRYAVDDVRMHGERVLVLARVQYLWRESGELGDESRVAIILRFRGGRMSCWRLYEDPLEGLEALRRRASEDGSR